MFFFNYIELAIICPYYCLSGYPLFLKARIITGIVLNYFEMEFFMFKQNATLLLCGLCGFSTAQAGTMADISNSDPSAVFVAAEGGWSWNKWNGVRADIVDVGRIFTSKNTENGSARVSVGVQKEVRPHFSVLGEIGYGYYGKTNFNFHQEGPQLSIAAGAPDFSQIHIKSTLDGFDVLAGLSYRISMIDLSFKAGAMVENARYKPSVNLSNIAPGNVFGSASLDANVTQVLPEIKLGVAYQLINNLSLTAAWSHVFGEKPGVNLTINPNFPPGIITIKAQNPTIDVFTLGASYSLPI